jgi:hypothetical protein
MTTTPKATTSVSETAGASGAAGLDVLCVMAPVAQNADMQGRIFGKTDDIVAFHGFSDGVDYCSFHFEETALSVLFVGLPITTPGVVGRVNASGNTGTSAVSAIAGGAGVLCEHAGKVKVLTGGTVGTDQIMLEVSVDGGRSTKVVRLGTATSYVIPDVNVGLTFTVGTLITGQTVLTWYGTAPLSDASSRATARANLAAGDQAIRSILFISDVATGAEAQGILDQLNAYETANERFVYGRVSIKDRLPYSELSHVLAIMTGTPAVTFAEVGGTGDTMTRATGSWLADGAAAGDWVAITGSTSNNVAGPCTGVTATVVTMGSTDFAAEVTSLARVTFSPALTFDAATHTIVRNRGSWLDDGFRIGDAPTIVGSVSNNGAPGTLTNVTATTLTFAAGLVNEVASSATVTITAGQTKAVHVAAMNAQFADVRGPTAFRLDLGLGRARKASPYNQWQHRRPVTWAASLREYRNDLMVAAWRKSLGNTGWDLKDLSKVLVEYDDRVDGSAASLAGFTSFKTWGNGPGGAYLSQCLTRASESSILSQTHNVAVVNLCCTTTQINTEDACIGVDLELDDEGHATSASLSTLAQRVNQALKSDLLENKKGQGNRASSAVWVPSTNDILNVPNAVLTGVVKLQLKGTVHDVNTKVAVQSNG